MASRVLCVACGRDVDDPGELSGFKCKCGGNLIRVPVPKPDASERRFAASVVGGAVGAILCAAGGVEWALLGGLVGSIFGLAAGWRN
jgi:DNA-directed RNA polymerase subunit RPC12/RpoP